MLSQVPNIACPWSRPGHRAALVPTVDAVTAGTLTKVEQDRLVEANMALVAHLARRYQGRGLDLDDLVQLGAMGLRLAASRFDPGLGWKVSTFAAQLIKRTILAGIRDTARAIRVPAHADVSTAAFKRMRRQLPDGATEEEVFDAMGLPPGRRRPVRDALRAKVGADNSELDRLTVEPDDALAGLILEEQQEQLERALQLLPPELAAVVVRRHGLQRPRPLTIAETVRELGISERTVRRREAEGLNELRRLLCPAGPDDD